MKISELRQKIESQRDFELGRVYDDIMYADMFRISSKLQKYCPNAHLLCDVYYYSKTLIDKQNDVYRALYSVVYYVTLPDDELNREFGIAYSLGKCYVSGIRAQTTIYNNDDEETKAQKLQVQLDVALEAKKKDIMLDALDEDSLRKVNVLLWKNHIPDYLGEGIDQNFYCGGRVCNPLYITKCADAHKLCINLPKMNKIMWEIVEENVQTLKLKRACEITEYIKNKHKAIENKQDEIKRIEKEIEEAQNRKEEMIQDNSCDDLNMLFTRIR
ncbi:MAG: hypothetical protein IJU58_01915 [Clostridia bacterium]|nr:hypothetical protein [Clostridia bacterium]